ANFIKFSSVGRGHPQFPGAWLAERILDEIIKLVCPRREARISSQRLGIVHCRPACHLVLDEEHAVLELRRQLLEEVDARDETIAPDQTGVDVAAVEAKVGNDELTLELLDEKQAEDE